MSPYVTSQSIKIVWKSTAQLLFGSHPHGVPSVPLPDICRGLGRGVGSQQPREQKSLREASCWGPDWTLISCAAQLLNQLGRHCRILLDSVPDFPSEREPEDFFRKNHFLIHHVFHRMFSWWSWSGSIWLHMAPYGSFGGRGSKQDLKARWVLMPLSRNQALQDAKWWVKVPPSNRIPWFRSWIGILG